MRAHSAGQISMEGGVDVNKGHMVYRLIQGTLFSAITAVVPHYTCASYTLLNICSTPAFLQIVLRLAKEALAGFENERLMQNVRTTNRLVGYPTETVITLFHFSLFKLLKILTEYLIHTYGSLKFVFVNIFCVGNGDAIRVVFNMRGAKVLQYIYMYKSTFIM